MAATPQEQTAEHYQVALDGYMDNHKWVEPPDAAMARRAANFLNALIVLTPQMSQIDAEKVMFSIEELGNLLDRALRAGAARGRVTAFENPVSRP